MAKLDLEKVFFWPTIICKALKGDVKITTNCKHINYSPDKISLLIKPTRISYVISEVWIDTKNVNQRLEAFEKHLLLQLMTRTIVFKVVSGFQRQAWS